MFLERKLTHQASNLHIEVCMLMQLVEEGAIVDLSVLRKCGLELEGRICALSRGVIGLNRLLGNCGNCVAGAPPPVRLCEHPTKDVRSTRID